MPDSAAEDLRYPVGPYRPPAEVRRSDLDAWIAELDALPRHLRDTVAGLNDAQLDTPYRPGGWTVRQIVHHLADGHLNVYTRYRLALTEQTPTVKSFDVDAWAELPDAKSGPVEPSLALIEGLHGRWTRLLRSLSDADLERSYQHPEDEEPAALGRTLGYFAWHSRHHVAQILALRKRHGW